MSLALFERRKITMTKGRQLRALIRSLVAAETMVTYAGPMPADADLRKTAQRKAKALEKFICSIEDI